MNNSKKILAFFIAIVMALAYLPVDIFAADPSAPVITFSKDAVR